MERIKVSENFYLDEFVDPDTYFNSADNGRSKVRQGMIDIAQFFRDTTGRAVMINNWWSYYKKNKDKKDLQDIIDDILKSKTRRKWSGYRSPKCTIGSTRSAHKKEGAIDMKMKGKDGKWMSGKKMFALAKKHIDELYDLGLRRLEDPKITKTWLHCDLRNRKQGAVAVVDLRKVTEFIYVKNAA